MSQKSFLSWTNTYIHEYLVLVLPINYCDINIVYTRLYRQDAKNGFINDEWKVT